MTELFVPSRQGPGVEFLTTQLPGAHVARRRLGWRREIILAASRGIGSYLFPRPIFSSLFTVKTRTSRVLDIEKFGRAMYQS